MTLTQFIAGLAALDGAVWRELVGGRALLLVDDQRFEPGSSGVPNVLIVPEEGVDLRQYCLDEAEEIYRQYYRTHPLTLAGFNRQVQALFDQYGPESFTAPEGQVAERTLFVDGGEVQAQSAESPTHRYGTYLELVPSVLPQSPGDKARQWLESGRAYDTYLSMNVCRYNCGV